VSLTTVFEPEYIGPTHSQGSSRLDDAATCHKLLTLGRIEKIDLEFGCEHAGTAGVERKSSVSGGSVGNGGGGPGMEIPMLLGQFRPERQRQICLSWSEMGYLDTEMFQERLPGEARSYPFLPVRIAWFKSGHVTPSQQGSARSPVSLPRGDFSDRVGWFRLKEEAASRCGLGLQLCEGLQDPIDLLTGVVVGKPDAYQASLVENTQPGHRVHRVVVT